MTNVKDPENSFRPAILPCGLQATTYPANEQRVLILASYCGDDDPGCSDIRPCKDCLAMCNVAIARGTLEVLGGLDYMAEHERSKAKQSVNSPAWPGPGCYVSPYPTVIADQYDYRTGDYHKVRQHLFMQSSGVPAKCNPAACRECYREQNWHDHGETEA